MLASIVYRNTSIQTTGGNKENKELKEIKGYKQKQITYKACNKQINSLFKN